MNLAETKAELIRLFLAPAEGRDDPRSAVIVEVLSPVLGDGASYDEVAAAMEKLDRRLTEMAAEEELLS